MSNVSVRALLAILLVVGGLVLFGIHRLSFDQLAALTLPPIALYFGQYITPPTGKP